LHAHISSCVDAKPLNNDNIKLGAKMRLNDLFETSAAERMVRSENRGDAHVANRIKDIRAKQKAGLISDREAEAMINKMTKSSKELASKKGTKYHIERDVR
jgi:hypothetical protein